jgi:actin-like protein 6A
LASKAKIYAPPKIFERQHAAWIAASIVASSNIFESRTLTRSDYEEHGSSLIEKKMFY